MQELNIPNLLPLEPGNIGHIKYNCNHIGKFSAYDGGLNYWVNREGIKNYPIYEEWQRIYRLRGPVLIEVVDKILVDNMPTITFNTQRSLMHAIIVPKHFERIMGLKPINEP